MRLGFCQGNGLVHDQTIGHTGYFVKARRAPVVTRFEFRLQVIFHQSGLGLEGRRSQTLDPMRGLAFLDTYRTISLNKLRLTQRLETMARLRRPMGVRTTCVPKGNP
jgi:hypothetical protein